MSQTLCLPGRVNGIFIGTSNPLVMTNIAMVPKGCPGCPGTLPLDGCDFRDFRSRPSWSLARSNELRMWGWLRG